MENGVILPKNLPGAKGKLIFYFYIDPEHYPYGYNEAYAIDAPENKPYDVLISSSVTWLLWTFRTYLELKDRYDCKLVDQLPDEGVTFFFRGSVNMDKRPSPKQFWISIVADSIWQPFSQINIFQNKQASEFFSSGYFLRHWPPIKIIKNAAPVHQLKNLFYIGDLSNLCPEVKSTDWATFLKENDFTFTCPPTEKWNDYTDVDAIIAIRKFDNNPEYNKPGTKLINAWLGNVLFFGTNESGYRTEVGTPYDMIMVGSYAELKSKLLGLKNDSAEISRYKDRAIVNAERFTIEQYRNNWIELIERHVVPQVSAWNNLTPFQYRLYILKKVFRKGMFSIKSRLMKNADDRLSFSRIKHKPGVNNA